MRQDPDLDLSWLDRVSEAVEARFGPLMRGILAELRRMRETERRE